MRLTGSWNIAKRSTLARFTLVADRNTYPVLGQAAEAALRARQWDLNTVVLDAPEVVPDEVFITEVLLHADQSERVYLEPAPAP